MLEAYEIGISLALQDGVSAGIALIRRDLAALDRAIAATSQNLARLQTQAGQTPNLPRAASAPPNVPPKPATPAAAPPPGAARTRPDAHATRREPTLEPPAAANPGRPTCRIRGRQSSDRTHPTPQIAQPACHAAAPTPATAKSRNR